MNGERGFTMVELMISACVLTIFSSVALNLVVQAEQEHRLVTSYQDDVAECRAVLRCFEQDVRAASQITAAADEVVVAGMHGKVVYRVTDGQLCVVRGDERRVLARCVESLQVTRDGALVTLVLQLCRRSQQVPEREAVLTTTVAMRNWEEQR